MTTCVAGRLERCQRAVAEPREEGARIVDLDRLDSARDGVLARLDERLRHRSHAVDRTVQPHGRVDAMRQQIPGHAAAGHGSIEAPQPFSSLWQLLRDRPVLEELRAIVKDASQLSFLDQLSQEDDGRNPAVVVPDRVRHASALDSTDHRFRLGDRSPERLLTQHHLAGARGGDRDLGVRVVRARDIDQVDVRAFDQLAPIGLNRAISPVGGERLEPLPVARRDRLQDGLERQIEVARRLQKRVRVRTAHEAVADEPDVEFLLHAFSATTGACHP